MGVKDFWTIAAPFKEKINVADLKGNTLAVDLSIWVCEMQTAKVGGHSTAASMKKMYLRNLFFRISHLLQCGVRLIFVCDNKHAPDVKHAEMRNRNNTRFKYQNSKKHVTVKHSPRIKKTQSRSHFVTQLKECCKLLDGAGICWMCSVGEAEATCAQLNATGVCDGCLTDDSDAFLYGANTVYRSFTMEGKCGYVERYRVSDLAHSLHLSRGNMIALAILLGCDYLPKGVSGVGREQALRLLEYVHRESGSGGSSLLDRFHVWASGRHNVPSQQSEELRHMTDQLQHCPLCAAGESSQQPPTTTCHCHQLQNRYAQLKLELAVCRKCLAQPGFPYTNVISEYSDFVDPAVCNMSRTDVVWKRPSLLNLQEFMLSKLEWPKSYTVDKVLPLVTLWDMMDIMNKKGNNSDVHLEPQSIIKSRVRCGTKCYEVQWRKPVWLSEMYDDENKENATEQGALNHQRSAFTTIETADMLRRAYPNLVNQFEHHESTKQKRKRGAVAKTSCGDVTQQPPRASPLLHETGSEADDKSSAITQSQSQSSSTDNTLRNKPLTLAKSTLRRSKLQTGGSCAATQHCKSTGGAAVSVKPVCDTGHGELPSSSGVLKKPTTQGKRKDPQLMTLEEIVEMRLFEKSTAGVNSVESPQDVHKLLSKAGGTPVMNISGKRGVFDRIVSAEKKVDSVPGRFGGTYRANLIDSPDTPVNCFKQTQSGAARYSTPLKLGGDDSWEFEDVLFKSDARDACESNQRLHLAGLSKRDENGRVSFSGTEEYENLADSIQILSIIDGGKSKGRVEECPVVCDTPPETSHRPVHQQPTPSMFDDTF